MSYFYWNLTKCSPSYLDHDSIDLGVCGNLMQTKYWRLLFILHNKR